LAGSGKGSSPKIGVFAFSFSIHRLDEILASCTNNSTAMSPKLHSNISSRSKKEVPTVSVSVIFALPQGRRRIFNHKVAKVEEGAQCAGILLTPKGHSVDTFAKNMKKAIEEGKKRVKQPAAK
jgi:hypothetical protein